MISTLPCAATEAELVDEIARLDELQNAIAAAKADVILRFARAHVESQIASGSVEPEALDRSIAAQVGLALRVSPVEGRKRVRIARDLHAGLDHVRALFAAGLLTEYKIAIIVAATSHLSPDERAAVDRELVTQHIDTLGVRRIHDLARRIAAEIAPEKFAARAAAARADRRVSVRPSADGMADLIAHLPVEEAVACYAALNKAATDVAVSPEPVTRNRSQIMADTLVERITGQATARDVDIEVQILVPIDALLDPTVPLPVEIPGHGPIPADLLATTEGRKTFRRLFTRDGIVIGGDSRRRTFDGNLARFIRARDGNRCSEPYCDAPVRHIDHINRWADGGATSFDNGRGLCEFHNHLRETAKNWKLNRIGDTIITTTPTGHSYTSEPARITPRPGPSPRRPPASQGTGVRR